MCSLATHFRKGWLLQSLASGGSREFDATPVQSARQRMSTWSAGSDCAKIGIGPNICIRPPPQVRPGNSSTVAVSTTTAATTETSGQNMNTCQTDLLSENLQIGRRSLLKRHNIGTSVLFASFPPRDSQKIHPIWKAAEPSLAGTTCQCRRDMRWNTKAFECQV